MNCNTTHYRANSSSVPGDPTGGTGNGTLPGNVIKFATDGTKTFDLGYGTSPATSANSITVDSAGNIYVAGFAYEALDGEPYGGAGDVYAMKIDNAGTRVWTRELGTAGIETGGGIAVNAAGDVFVCGTAAATLAGANDAGPTGGLFATKLSSDGGTQWLVQTNSSNLGCDRARATGATDVILGGTGSANLSGGPGGGGHAFVIRLDGSNGNRLWINQNWNAVGQSQSSAFGAIAVTSAHVFEAFTTGYNDGYPTVNNSNGFLRRIGLGDGGRD